MAITTNIDYPESLPWPMREGYDINYVPTFRRTQLASGRARQRKTFASVPAMCNVNFMLLGDNQAAAFDAWFHETLNDGAEWFNAKMKTPLGEGRYVCRFAEMYKGPTLAGPCAWRVSALLEMWERPLMPEGWGLMPDFLAESDIFDVAMNDRWPGA